MNNPTFRIWDKTRRRWLWASENSLHCFTDFSINLNGGVCAYEGAIESGFCQLDQDLCQKDYVVQRNTGAKDKNGREIYEGDIAKYRVYDNWFDRIGQDFYLVVAYSNIRAGFALYPESELEKVHLSYGISIDNITTEIVGNIFEGKIYAND